MKFKNCFVLFTLLLMNCQPIDDNLKTSRPPVLSEINQVLLEDLGHFLFFDKRLSRTNEKSCATCHNPIFAFTDGYRKGRGVYGSIVKHNTPSVLNLEDNYYLNWADSTIHDFQTQMLGPLFNESPKELGLKNVKSKILHKLNQDTLYLRLLQKANIKQTLKLSFPLIQDAISQYLKNLTSRNSSIDKFNSLPILDTTLISKNSRIGLNLFYSDRLGCDNCHGGRDFDDALNRDNYASIGLTKSNQGEDRGLYEKTKYIQDIGKFRIPSLRNIMLTKPYFHDGRESNIKKAIKEMTHSKKNLSNRYPIDSRLSQDSITNQEIEYIINFLYELTDTSYLRDSYYKDPFKY